LGKATSVREELDLEAMKTFKKWMIFQKNRIKNLHQNENKEVVAYILKAKDLQFKFLILLETKILL
jgi:hypothetical protein